MHKYLDEFLKSLNLILAENPGASLHDIKSAIELDGPISAAISLLGYFGEIDRVYDGSKYLYWVKGGKPSNVISVPFPEKGQLTELQKLVYGKCLEQQGQRFTPSAVYALVKEDVTNLGAVCTAMRGLCKKGLLIKVLDGVYALAVPNAE